MKQLDFQNKGETNMSHNTSKSERSYKTVGLALGLVLGGLIGWLIGNPIIFAGGGLVLGLAIGSAVDNTG